MTKHVTLFNLFVVVALLMSLAPVQAAPQPAEPAASQPADVGDPIQRLVDATGGTANVSTSKATGVARFVRLEPTSLPAFKLNRATEQAATEQAMAFFRAYGGAFGIRDPQRELEFKDVSTDQFGARHVEYAQVYKGVPIFAGVLRVHFDKSGQLTAINGTFVPDIKLNATPALNAEDAAAIAVGHVAGPQAKKTPFSPNQSAEFVMQGPERQMTHATVQGDLTARSTTLYVFRANLARGVPGANHLVYEVEVGNGSNVREFVYVDAQSGEIVDQITGIRDNLYRRAFNGDANYPYTTFWVEGDPFPTGNVEADKVLNGAREIYNVIASLTGGAFLSWDGADAVMDSVFNDTMGGSCPNAHWTGAYSGFCTGVSGDDTVGHEWGHAYTQGTHNLIYQWQSGALDETYSDMWGEVVDFLNGRGSDSPGGLRMDGHCSVYGAGTPSVDDSYRWLSGEDDTGGAIRDMWWPNCYGDPNNVTDAQYFCGSGDGGGVHTNCGVSNHAFALLTDGGTFNGYTINGIGVTKTAHLYWRTQSVYQVPTTDFADHADALEQSCQDLIDQPLYELSAAVSMTAYSTAVFTTTDCIEVGNVISAVEFRFDPTDQCGFEPMLDPDAPSLCSALEAPVSIYSEDWESGNLGSWTVGARDVYSPATYIIADWFVTSTLPSGRAGSAVLAVDPSLGSCGGPDDQSGVRYLESVTITIPAEAATPRLVFDNWVATELGYDGGNVKISVNGGPWTLVPPSAFTFNPYPAVLSTGGTSPLAGEPAFTGSDEGTVGGSWGQSQVDLSGLASQGDEIKLRFEMGMDGCGGVIGWYVDDVELYHCVLGAHGTLHGVISDDSAGPIVGAQIEATLEPTQTLFSTSSGAGGAYSMPLLTGVYTVTASAFGYTPETVYPVNIISGSATAQDFTLTAMPAAILSGTVTDANTGWALYAFVGIPGYPGGGVWTDPETGGYSVSIPTGITYTLTVEAWVDGYLTAIRDVNLTGNQVEDFALDADLVACNAPGYGGGDANAVQDGSFEDGSPNSYWTESGSLASPLCDPNTCNGVEKAHTGTWYAWYGGWSQTNVAAVSQTVTIPNTGAATLSFWLEMQATPGTDDGLLEVKLDGTTLLSFTEADGPTFVSYTQVDVDVSSYADGGTYDLQITGYETGTTGINFFVDDVALITSLPCIVPNGGLVIGNVYDANTGDELNDVTVSNDSGQSNTTGPVSDPAADEGFYTLYSPAGSHTFTAALAGYSNAIETPNVEAGGTIRQDFDLSAPMMNVAPATLSSAQGTDVQRTRQLTIANEGTAALEWTVSAGLEYDNGPLVNSPGTGAGGADESMVQTVSLGMSVNGFGHALSSGYRIADDLMVSGGDWPINTITFYAYQSGSAITSTINHVNLRIWDGPPNDPASAVIFGDTTTNRMVSTRWSGIYRVGETTSGATNRPIMASTVNVGIILSPGTYWLDWQSDGTLASGPWAPPITINGLTTTGNALQFDGSGWSAAVDVGQQGFPFTINEGNDIPWITLAPISGTTASGVSSPINVTFDSTGLALGTYTGELAIHGNAPLEPWVIVPVELNVVVPPTFTLTVDNIVGSGTVTLDPPGGVYDEGTIVTLTATPDPGWLFVGWSGDVSGATNPVSVTVDSDLAVTATFALACVEVADVNLSVTGGTLAYTDTLVMFSIDIMPNNASKPYTYTVDYGDGITATATSSADPLALSHTFTAVDTYTVKIEVWNCSMTAPVTDTVQVVVNEKPAPLLYKIYLPILAKNSS